MRHHTSPLEQQKILLSYRNIKMQASPQPRAAETLEALQKTIERMNHEKSKT